MESIKNLAELKINKQTELFILLNGGLRSSKTVTFNNNNSWKIHNEIDDTFDNYKNDEAFEKGYPLFFNAMEAGSLIKY